MGKSTFIIQQGDPDVEETAVTFLGIGSAGDFGIPRIMTHPNNFADDVALSPIVYALGDFTFNPHRTLNLDNDVLYHPITDAPLTLGSRRVVRFETAISDVLITELWEGSKESAAMPTALFRMFYEYVINPPPYDDPEEYITWQPRDRNDYTYLIELVALTVGGAPGSNNDAQFDVADIRDRGGLQQGGTSASAMDRLSPSLTGLIDQNVYLQFRIVGKVV